MKAIRPARIFFWQQRNQWNIWQFNRVLSQRLLWWAGVNVIVGIWMQQRQNKFWRGVAMQLISWGTINGIIAIAGNQITQIRRNQLDSPDSTEVVQREYRNLFRILWVNATLDIGYMIGGVILAKTRGSHDRLMRGSGWGIVFQGGFLFIFDLVHAWIMASESKQSNRKK